MISEVTDGVILDYVPDALGSVHTVVDQSAVVVKSMRYKPYGEVLSRSGTVADRHYQWVGSYGYRATFAPSSSHYVRARHYNATSGSWTTVDPLWPDESAYGYVYGRATGGIDPTGQKPKVNYDCDLGDTRIGIIEHLCQLIDRCKANKKCWKIFSNCVNSGSSSMTSCINDYCSGKKSVNLSCNGRLCCSKDNAECKACGKSGLPCICPDLPDKAFCGYTFGFGCKIHICSSHHEGCSDLGDTVLHELSHCCGATDGGTNDAYGIGPCINVIRNFV